MQIEIGFDIAVQRQGPAPLVLALQLRPEEEQRLQRQSAFSIWPEVAARHTLDSFGNRRMHLADGSGPLRLQWRGTVTDHGLPDQLDTTARQAPIFEVPEDVMQYLSPSRFCQSDLLMSEAWNRFGHVPEGWARVQAVCDFVHGHIEFGYNYAHHTKSAVDVLQQGRGVCRDFAHLTITFCRALNIPARYVSGYLGDIGVPYAGPGDFCAWVEVFVGGVWRTVDARHNVPRIGRVKMVHGRDAVDVPMIASFGRIDVQQFAVFCDEINEKAA